MASAVSFQGLSTNLQTDKLVDAIIQQEGLPIQRMQDRQALGAQRASLVRTIKANLYALNTSISNLSTTGFLARTVTSSDSNGTYASATASGAAVGSYDLVVSKVATKARLTSANGLATSTTSLGGTETSPGSGTYEYVLTDKTGTATTVTLSAANNTLAGLRDAINAKSGDTGVGATLVQTAATGDNYKLVLTSTDTGLGTLVGGATTSNDSIYLKGSAGNALGLASTGDGSQSAEKAQNAEFSVNGLAMMRKSNTVTDAVDGVTFTLKAGDPTKTTTFSVAQDQNSAANALQDVVTKFNAILKVYKDNSGTGGALANDSTLRTLVSQVRSAVMSSPTGISAGSTYRGPAELGLKTNRDGTMELDTTAFKAALDKDPTAVANVFSGVQANVQTFTNRVTSPSSGNIAIILQTIDDQNTRLTKQISDGQKRLDRRREALQRQYANLEAVVGQLQAAGQSLSGLTTA